ncbi:MAG: hypothetical protein LBJ44_05765 [Propionibacteriaceae bacterium]|jgi:hypothetical protein|nr:hypothetical protein [Propionibacteriaceae bacterium]
MIFAAERDPRLITIRRGGCLTEADHRLLAWWAADCAEHVLSLFEAAGPDDGRPRQAVAAARAWTRGEVAMMRCRAAGGHANGAARALAGPAREAAHAAGQAACVPHVADHALGAAAYGIRAARAAVPAEERAAAGRAECAWQREQLPAAIRDLVLDDQRRRNAHCWGLFDF